MTVAVLDLALRALESVEYVPSHEGPNLCPFCDRHEGYGHMEDCLVGEALIALRHSRAVADATGHP